MNNICILFCLFLFPLSIFSQDSRWIYVTSNETDSIDFYYDSQSIIYTDSSIVIWAKELNYGERIYSDPRTTKFNKLYYNTAIKDISASDEIYMYAIKAQLDRFIDYQLYQYELICNERMFRKLDNIEYFMDKTTNHPKSAENGSAIKRKILPETLLEMYFNKVCK